MVALCCHLDHFPSPHQGRGAPPPSSCRPQYRHQPSQPSQPSGLVTVAQDHSNRCVRLDVTSALSTPRHHRHHRHRDHHPHEGLLGHWDPGLRHDTAEISSQKCHPILLVIDVFCPLRTCFFFFLFFFAELILTECETALTPPRSLCSTLSSSPPSFSHSSTGITPFNPPIRHSLVPGILK